MALIFDQRLFYPAFAFDHIDQIIDDAVFQPHNDIQVSKTGPGIGSNDA